MNLADNLKRIRKEHNLSQEQLAEQLGVSRQSVSKWESNQAYPEMDKVLQLCKMFNLNIDELLNQNLKELNETKQSKNNINKLIDDFLDYITKTIEMFGNMRFKEKIKCIFELCVVSFIIIIFFIILGSIIMNIIQDLFRLLPDDVYYVLYQIFFDIYILICLFLGISLLLHIFKVRYLDYYVIQRDDEQEDNLDDKNINYKEKIKVKNSKVFYEQSSNEKIIIRDPKHSSYKFIKGLLKCLVLLIKTIVFIFAMAFSFSLITLIFLIIISFLFVETGLLFGGFLLSLLSLIIVNLIILNILYNFIISHQTKKRLLSTVFIISLITLGIGIGLVSVSLLDFKYITDFSNNHYIESEKNILMKENTFILYASDDQYIESDIDNIKIVYKHSKYYNLTFDEYDNGYIQLWFSKNADSMEIIKGLINDINHKEIVDYDNFDFLIYASKENIIKLKNNRDVYLNRFNN